MTSWQSFSQFASAINANINNFTTLHFLSLHSTYREDIVHLRCEQLEKQKLEHFEENEKKRSVAYTKAKCTAQMTGKYDAEESMASMKESLSVFWQEQEPH